MVSGKGVSRTGWAQSADRRPKIPSVKLFQAADSSMDSMSMEITHVWNTPGKGSFLRECVVIKSLPIGHYLIMAA
jgi:hypothetical protein